MQALLLAAGESSRFWPLSDGTHKSLAKVAGKSLLEWTIGAVKRAGIKDIIIIQNPTEAVEKELGDGKKLGVSIRYATQIEPNGMGDAVIQVENLISGPFVVLNPNHPDADILIKEAVSKSKKTGAKMVLLGKETDTPWKYGILALQKDKILKVVEKPEQGKEPSNVRVIGMYLLPKEFFSYYHRTSESHYSFEDALTLYASENDARAAMVEEDAGTLKYPWDLFRFWMHAPGKRKIAKTAKIDKSAKIDGDVIIGENVRVFENAVIKGPSYIGDNSVIGNNVLVRESDIEENVVVGANAEIARSIIGAGTHLHSGFLGDSIIAQNCRVGAGIITGNVRLDRGEISSIIKGEKIGTKMRSLGAIIGNDTKIGIGVKTMPGVLIGTNCVIGPGTVVNENVESGTIYYSKFESVVKKKSHD